MQSSHKSYCPETPALFRYPNCTCNKHAKGREAGSNPPLAYSLLEQIQCLNRAHLHTNVSMEDTNQMIRNLIFEDTRLEKQHFLIHLVQRSAIKLLNKRFRIKGNTVYYHKAHRVGLQYPLWICSRTTTTPWTWNSQILRCSGTHMGKLFHRGL